MATINGVNVTDLQQTKDRVTQDPAAADREPTVAARWLGGSASRVESNGKTAHIGGEGNLNPMQNLLASLAACDIDLIAMHAALIGLPIKDLRIEVTGHFNSQAYYGVEGAPGAGYDRIAYTVHLTAPQATAEQIDHLRQRCERSSPVGDSLGKSIPLTLKIKQV